MTQEGLIENQIVKIISGDKPTPAEMKEAKGMIRLRKGKVKDIFTQPVTKKRYPINPLMEITSCQDNNPPVTNSPEKRFPADEKEVYYLDDGVLGGAPLFGETFDPADEKLAENIAATIREYVYQKNLEGLENSASSVPSQIKVSLQAIPKDAINERCENGKKKYSPNKDKFKGFQDVKDNKIPLGSFFQIKIKNNSGESRREKMKKEGKDPVGVGGYNFYISVVDLTTSGEIKIIYPLLGINTLADGGEITILLKSTEPIGLEKFVIVISTDSYDFSFYQMTKGKRKSPKSLLEQILIQSGKRSRDAGTLIEDEPDKWGVIHPNVNIFE